MLQVAFSPRELKLVTAGDDSEVRVWDLTKKACIATLKVSLQQCSLQRCNDCSQMRRKALHMSVCQI